MTSPGAGAAAARGRSRSKPPAPRTTACSCASRATPTATGPRRARLPDPGPGVAYTFQLIGLEVRTSGGRTLGTLEEVISTGANPVYVVRGEREWLVPAAPGVVQHVDMEARTLVVELPAGLEDLTP
jgi:ribosomal 30S subunit maturation factor RimM